MMRADDPLVRGYVTAQLNSLGYATRSVAEAERRWR
jgi:hypothetical protein